MKVKLTRPARIRHEAGEIVEVSPAEYAYLASIGSAIPAGKATSQAGKKAAASDKKK